MPKKQKEPVQTERHNRWVVASAFSVLAWCAWWYSRGGNQGLFITTCIMGSVAFVLPRALPNVTRWVVWTWVGTTVILFAANVARLMPPDNNAMYYEHLLDRVVSAFYAVGVATLFFRLSWTAVTTIILSVLPMLMLTLSRAEGADPLLTGAWNVLLIGFLVLATLFDQLSQLLRPGAFDQRPIPFWREIGLRYGLLVMMLGGGIALRQPVEESVLFVQKQLLGLVTRSWRTQSTNSDLSLTQRLPKHFDRRMRVVMLIQGPEVPGYLREMAYTDYQGGRWVVPKQTRELMALPERVGQGKSLRYALAMDTRSGTETNEVWRFEVQAPRLLQAFCLPGHAQTLSCSGRDYLTDSNGMVRSEQVIPERYEVETRPLGPGAKAYPLPDGGADPAYLVIPHGLKGAVSNWVASCEGLRDMRGAMETGRLLERYFQNHFAYRLDVQFGRYPDPLLQFMENREGFCIHFASAATLMLRARGIPARVVAGFASFGYNPWLERWVVREREGHAWVELWDAAQGQWRILDPTPAEGRPSAYRAPHLLRRLLDLLVTGWSRLIVWIKNANFLMVIAEAGIWCFDLVVHLLRTPLGWCMLLGIAGGLWWRRKRRLLRMSPEARYRLHLVQQMQRKMRKKVPAALRRLETESWDGWLTRIEARIPRELYEELQADVETYQSLRYRSQVYSS